MSPQPPHRVELLLEGLGARQQCLDEVVGDLAEEFAERVERDGVSSARRWYYREAAATAPHLVRDWLRSVDAPALWEITVAVGTSTFASGICATLVRELTTQFGMGAHVITSNGVPHTAGTLFGLAFSGAFGGYVAARNGTRAPLMATLALGAAWSCAAIGVGLGIASVSLWYEIAAPVVLLAGTVVGGMLCVASAPIPVACSDSPQ